MELQGKIINFLGDSITEGVGTTSPDKVFHQLIKEEYNLKMAYNCGIGGTRIARQTVPSEKPRHDLTFEIRSVTMDKNADAIVVFGGTNDFGHGDALFGDPESDSEDIYTFCGAVNSLITSLEKQFPNAKIVFMTPLHRKTENEDRGPEGIHLCEYVKALKTILEKRNVSCIDLFEINPIDVNITELIPDGLHPSDEGHRILAKVVAQELLKI